MNGPREKFWVEINIAALRHNVREVQKHIGPGKHILFVVKSDGYGHGAVEVVRAALAEGVESFGVATLAEGLALRRAGISEEIVLLQPSLDFELEEVISANLRPSLSDFATARRLSEMALGRPVHLHVEINTGMNRMGFNPEAALADIPRVAKLPDIHLAGAFTHFRPITPASLPETKRNLSVFNSIIEQLGAQGVHFPRLHTASSHAILYCTESYFDTVRPGLLMYGGYNGTLPPNEPLTEPVMACRCRVLHVRQIKKSEWVHYGENFQAPRDMTVAIIAAGYGAGYPKSLSNSGEVLIAGHRAKICGVVGMDMTIVDVSAHPSMLSGDVVTLLGVDGSDEITVAELAKNAATIPYEILCRFGRNLPRVFTYPAIGSVHDGSQFKAVSGATAPGVGSHLL